MINPQSIRDRARSTWAAENVRTAAFKVIDRMQGEPHYQIVGTAVALVAMCEGAGIDMRHLIETAERHIGDVESPFTNTVEAIRSYARHEITRSSGL